MQAISVSILIRSWSEASYHSIDDFKHNIRLNCSMKHRRNTHKKSNKIYYREWTKILDSNKIDSKLGKVKNSKIRTQKFYQSQMMMRFNLIKLMKMRNKYLISVKKTICQWQNNLSFTRIWMAQIKRKWIKKRLIKIKSQWGIHSSC